MNAEQQQTRRKTNIVCTMGRWTSATDSSSVERLTEIIDAGMTVMRLNFSHGTHESHAQCIKNLKKALSQRPNKHVAIMLDTKGPEIRTGMLREDSNPLQLKKGQDLEVTTDYTYLGNSECIACSYSSLCSSVTPGQTVLCADGSLVLTVVSIGEKSIMTRVECDASIGERKNMNLPGVVVDLPVVTEKDTKDLLEFGLSNPIDMIALSFTRKASDVKEVRALLGPRGRHIKIVCKIENQEGLENFDAILAEADGIMVARGDLGMEIAPEKVFLAQKMMIKKCNVAGKPVITATQMLESMIQNPRPTRAECTDVANAVLDGTDCVMLSGETANGAFPVEAVTMMDHVCKEAESCINYEELYLSLRSATMNRVDKMITSEAITSSAVKTAMDMGAKMLVVLTESGNTARLVAKYRPQQTILVMTAKRNVADYVGGLLRGCEARFISSMVGTDNILLRAAQYGKDMGIVKPGDQIVAVHGVLEAMSGATNMLRVLTVP